MILVVRVTPHQDDGNTVHRAKHGRWVESHTARGHARCARLEPVLGGSVLTWQQDSLESEVLGNGHASFGGGWLEKRCILYTQLAGQLPDRGESPMVSEPQ